MTPTHPPHVAGRKLNGFFRSTLSEDSRTGSAPVWRRASKAISGCGLRLGERATITSRCDWNQRVYRHNVSILVGGTDGLGRWLLGMAVRFFRLRSYK